ncbi:MAG: response regulator [Phycisphaeraceae bacterium]|nr:response regulator [Phycisphaeraceae bacterium]
MDVLIIEDNRGDVRLLEEAFAQSGSHPTLHIVTDGEQAMQFLRREQGFATVPRPDLVLLDLNLPRKSGLDVLAEVKSDDALRPIPVIVLTTSRSPQDIRRVHDLHGNCYITKPVDLDEFLEIVGLIDRYWLTVVSLPAKD